MGETKYSEITSSCWKKKKVKVISPSKSVAQRVPGSSGSQITWQWPRMVVRLSGFAPAGFTPQEIILVLISVRGRVDPRAIVRSEGLCQGKIPMTPAGIEPATFRFVAQHLNHCATAVPQVPVDTTIHYSVTTQLKPTACFGLFIPSHLHTCRVTAPLHAMQEGLRPLGTYPFGAGIVFFNFSTPCT